MDQEPCSRPGTSEASDERAPASAPSTTPEWTSEEIQQWIVNYLAKVLEKRPEEIDVTIPFDGFALDSVTAIGMTGELENWLGRKVDPTLLFDYPTVEQFSQSLSKGAGS